MPRGFCPECGLFTFGYDPRAEVYRCYRAGCGFKDIKGEYGEGLRENPFIKDPFSKLEILASSSVSSKEITKSQK